MKKIIIAVLFLALSAQCFCQNPKYVFVVFGDGMGLNTINLTEYYKASLKGQHGTEALNFCKFPVCSYMTTWSADSQITDSAAAATALASGVKTNNGYAGVDPKGDKVELITEKLAAKGMKVAIVTTDAVNYATEAGFAAHRDARKSYTGIFEDMLANGFDFYAGCMIKTSDKSRKDYKENFDPVKEAKKAGYTLVGNMEECSKCSKKADKIIFVPDSEHSIGRAIERRGSDKIAITVADYTTAAINFLMKDGCKDGFFLLAEVGTIDHNCHGNDAAAAVLDVIELEKVTDVALSFYNEHPTETAILVISDHDTGGLALTGYNFDPSLLQYQKYSISRISDDFEKLFKGNAAPNWDETKAFLSENLGLWSQIKLKDEEDKRLKGLYDDTVSKLLTKDVADEFGYNSIKVLVNEAVAVANKHCGVVWTTHSHSAAYAPLFYMGPRPELFTARTDNTEFPTKILELVGE